VRVAFVVQRYGAEVAGGAEALARQTAHALAAAGDEVVVYTTTARDYLRWAPHFPAGEARDGPVRVRRFPVEPADPARAEALLRALARRPGDPALEAEWARAQGPVSRPLLGALAEAGAHHEAVAVWTYLYATSQMGLPLVAGRSVLVPLAHDEPMLRFGLTRGLVALAAGFAFLTGGPPPWSAPASGRRRTATPSALGGGSACRSASPSTSAAWTARRGSAACCARTPATARAGAGWGSCWRGGRRGRCGSRAGR
jgi:hypothetical protein